MPMRTNSIFFKIFILLFILVSTQSCNLYKPTNAREVSPNPEDRIKKNLEEGRGLRLATLGKQNTNFQFASSNPMWRASLDVLDFAPLLNANYSGGIIITDWISSEDSSSNEFYKITIKFLSNEVRADALKIVLHEKNCNANNICKISKIKSNTVESEISKKILRVASLYKKQDIKKLSEELGEYRVTTPKTKKNKSKKKK